MVNPRTGRVHTNFGQAVAVTGRLSSNEPNLQNIPIRNAEGRRIREAFVAPPGHQLLSADYSQIELRIMAHLSQDETLLAAFHVRGGRAPSHRRRDLRAARRARSPASSGATPRPSTSASSTACPPSGSPRSWGSSAAPRSSTWSATSRAIPGVQGVHGPDAQSARDQGYVETVFGRRLYMIDIRASNSQRRQAAERAAINAPMQGTAADLIKLAMIAVHRWLRERHLRTPADPAGARRARARSPRRRGRTADTVSPRLMTGVAQLSVPLVVDVGVGPNWDRAH